MISNDTYVENQKKLKTSQLTAYGSCKMATDNVHFYKVIRSDQNDFIVRILLSVGRLR